MTKQKSNPISPQRDKDFVKEQLSIPIVIARYKLRQPGEIISHLFNWQTEPLLITREGEIILGSTPDISLQNGELIKYDGVAEYIAKHKGWFYFPSRSIDGLINERSFSFKTLINALETVCQNINDVNERKNAEARLQSFKRDKKYIVDLVHLTVVKNEGPEIRGCLKREYGTSFAFSELAFGIMRAGYPDQISYKKLESRIDLNLFCDFNCEKVYKFLNSISSPNEDINLGYNSDRNSITVYWSVNDYGKGISRDVIQNFKTEVERVVGEIERIAKD